MHNDSSKFYVTTPIYYANAKPHLGHLYSTVLADVAARINKIAGKATFLLTGTDEHGQKIAQAAEATGKSPKALVDEQVHEFKKLWELYHIEYTKFIRTTDEYHVKGVQTWILKLIAKGDIYKGMYTGWYCIPDETFVQDKDHSGISESPSCPSCGRPTVELSEECYFFRLSAYQDRLLAFYREHPHFITPIERSHEIVNFVAAGLKDLSISRTTVAWGIPFPGDERHKVYVWADALNNYITALGYGSEPNEMDAWWPADLQVMGKDIVRFHAIYWPAFLMASCLELPHQLLVHGWFKVGEQKMSKSLGNAIDPFELGRVYGPDAMRYYLIRHMAITQDSPFSIEELEKRINSDLANDLGNLLNRMLTLAIKQGITVLQPPQQLTGPELDLRDKLWSMLSDFSIDMEEYYFHRAYGHVWKYINYVNAYFHAQEPWKLAATDEERFKAIISAVCHSLYSIGVLAWPIMPTKMNELLRALGIELEFDTNLFERLSVEPWSKTFTLTSIPPLFNRIEPSQPASPEQPTHGKSQETISIEQLSAVKLSVGTIISCEEVPKSDKMYKLEVDFGEYGLRQICSGVRAYFKKENLIGKQGVFVLNLAPRKIMGVESQGMMLFAEKSDGVLTMIIPAESVPEGKMLR